MCRWELIEFTFSSLFTVFLCILSEQYQLISKRLDVSSSKSECFGIDMQQVIIKDEATYAEVVTYLQRLKPSYYMWVGMYWDRKNQFFRWSHNDAKVVGIIWWCDNEPDYMTNPTDTHAMQDCVRLDKINLCLKTSYCDPGTTYHSLCQARNGDNQTGAVDAVRNTHETSTPCPICDATTDQRLTCEPCPTCDCTTDQHVTCEPCPTSDATLNKQATCEPCPTCDVTTNQHVTCEPCPTFDITTNQHVSCEPCPTSDATLNKQATCEPCPTCDVTTNPYVTCKPCPTIDVTTNQHVTSCEPCLTSDATINKEVLCEPCPTCDVTTNQQVTCEPCPTFDVTTNQQVTCEPCPTCDIVTNGVIQADTTTNTITKQSTAASQSFNQTAFQDSLYKVKKKETGSYRRRNTSAYDSRFSSKVIGVTGVIILVIVCCIFPALDMINLAQKTGKKRRSKTRK